MMLSFHILPERPGDAAAIEALLDRSFGPARQQRTVYRLRARVGPVVALCFVAVDDAGTLLASLRFWPVRVGETGTPALLFGPLAVEPTRRNQGLGRALLRHGLSEARRLGHRLCLVSGEPGYYAPYGFVPAEPHGLSLPGPIEPGRFQVLEMIPGALADVTGEVAPAEDGAAPRADDPAAASS